MNGRTDAGSAQIVTRFAELVKTLTQRAGRIESPGQVILAAVFIDQPLHLPLGVTGFGDGCCCHRLYHTTCVAPSGFWKPGLDRSDGDTTSLETRSPVANSPYPS